MPTIELLTDIHAPIETVFDLARSVDLHVDSTSQTNERAVGGTTTGLLFLGDTVTWHTLLHSPTVDRHNYEIRPSHPFSRLDATRSI